MDGIKRDELIEKVINTVQGRKYYGKIISNEDMKEAIREEVFIEGMKLKLSINEKKELVDKIYEDIKKRDILSPLLIDDNISKIVISNSNDIYIEKNNEVEKVESEYLSKEFLDNLVIKLIQENSLEDGNIIEGTLKGGESISIIKSPIACNGPVITIRKSLENKKDIDHLLCEKDLEILKEVIVSKKNIFISGKYKEEKSILLNELINYIPDSELIALVENELKFNIDKKVMRFNSKEVEDKGKLINTITNFALDRIVIDEVSDNEAGILIEAINDNLINVIATINCKSIYDCIYKLEKVLLNNGYSSREVVNRELASSLGVIINLGMTKNEGIKITDIYECIGYEKGEVILKSMNY